jgi:hypothetical protein
MQIVGTGYNIPWLPLPNEIALILDDQLPPLPAITSALALAFDGERILMTNLRQRGWDIPGGHLDPGETPEIQILYLARVAELVAFASTEETSQRRFFGPVEAQELQWVQENRLMYDQALAQAGKAGRLGAHDLPGSGWRSLGSREC